jgi:hypothetical protein
MAQTASLRWCSDSVNNVRVEQAMSGRGSNVVVTRDGDQAISPDGAELVAAAGVGRDEGC